MPTPATIAITTQMLFCLFGLWLLWKEWLAPQTRHYSRHLLPWEITPSDFLLHVVCVFGGAYLADAAVADWITPHFHGTDLSKGLIQGAAFQGGLLLGYVVSVWILRNWMTFGAPRPVPLPTQNNPTSVFATGTKTFFVALPWIHAIGFLWNQTLLHFGYPAQRQEMIDLFAKNNSPYEIIGMVLLATIAAPIAEEMMFRAGLFRFLRTRVSRPLALVFPALFFAVLHQNTYAFIPLFVLGLIFSLSYERSGKIGTTMVAHALFNLNTIIMILAGVTNK